MDRSHIAFLSFPHPPHVNPTLPIVSVLVRRGFHVSYVTSEKFRDRVVAVGAEVITCQSFDAQADHHFNKQTDRSGDSRLVDRAFELADNMQEVAMSVFETHPPAVLIYDPGAIAGRLLAHRLGVPSILTTPMFAVDLKRLDIQVNHAKFREEIIDTERAIAHHLKGRGIEAAELQSYAAAPTIHLLPRVLQPDGDVFGERYFYAGRCAGEQPFYGEWRNVCDCGRPIVLVSSSTTALQRSHYYRMCIEALDGLGWHVVLSIGDHGDASSLLPLPPHFEIVQTTSHLAILRYATLMICMGGNMTVSEALYHGVPLIVMSHGHPELEWQADNMAEKGFGIHLRNAETDSCTLRQAVLQISSGSKFHLRATRLKWAVRREPGAEETANRIEDSIHL